jgi:MFS family permease
VKNRSHTIPARRSGGETKGEESNSLLRLATQPAAQDSGPTWALSSGATSIRVASDPAPARTRGNATLQIVAIVAATFACYLVIGIPFATLPGYIHVELGYGPVMAGLAISVQYIATLLTRPRAGQMADAIGAKTTVLYGLAGCAASGVLLLGAAFAVHVAWLSLLFLLASRLVLGFGESCVATGAIAWGIGQVGPARSAQVMSWNGIATYGAIAVGAPLGVVVERIGGFAAAGATTIAISAAGWLFASTRRPAAVIKGARLSFGRVLTRILPYGVGLALGSVGFGAIAAFVALFFASRHWTNAAEALTAFGFCFVGVRLIFFRTIERFGGFRVAMISFCVECAGLLLLFRADSAQLALVAAALTGGGFALIFPSLGVEAIADVPAQSRGAALGAYAAFLDLALGVTGPLMGGLVATHGYPAAFLAVGVAAAAGALLTSVLWVRILAAHRRRVVAPAS